MKLNKSQLGSLVAIKKAYSFNKPYYIVATPSDYVANALDQFDYDHPMKFGVFSRAFKGSTHIGLTFADYRHALIFRTQFLNNIAGGV